MSVIEFILVALAIVVGLAVAEILRGVADTIRAQQVRVSYRLLLIAAWTLLLLWQFWWLVWQLGDRSEWAFPEFLAFLLPVAILYVISRLCFPQEIEGSDLREYFQRVAPLIFILIAATYATFALIMQPIIFGGIVPLVFASQLAFAFLALLASRFTARAFHFLVIAAMFAQVIWRGLSSTVGG